MVTFQSRDELVKAYRALLDLERKLNRRLSEDQWEVDDFSELLEKQSTIMTKIDTAEELDTELRNEVDSPVDSIMEQFADLREDNKQMLKESMNTVENQLESLDQAHELLKYYLQGDQRPDEGANLRIDEEV